MKLITGNMHHTGFVVDDVEQTLQCMEKQFGELSAMKYAFKPTHAYCNGEEVENYELKIIMVSMGEDNTNIEIIQPVSEGYHKDVVTKSNGGGIHHICYAVNNYDEIRKHFQEANAKFVFESETEDEVIGYRRCFYAEDAKGNIVEIKENPYFR